MKSELKEEEEEDDDDDDDEGVTAMCAYLSFSLFGRKRKERQPKPISVISSMCFMHCSHFSLSPLPSFVFFFFLFFFFSSPFFKIKLIHKIFSYKKIQNIPAIKHNYSKFTTNKFLILWS